MAVGVALVFNGHSGEEREREQTGGRFWRCLTFELSRHQRCDARARMAKMYRVPPAGPARHAVGARLERGVRHCCIDYWQSCRGCHGQVTSDIVREADVARKQIVKTVDTRVCALKGPRIAARSSRRRWGRARH